MKLIIWDADNTLWDGEIIYGEVKLKSETKEVLKQISKLNIPQIICSKNDIDKLKKVLETFEIDKYFKEVHANWQPKHLTVKSILERLNIDPKETLFIDDDTLNREEIKMLTGCHVDYNKDLYDTIKYVDTSRLVLMEQQRNRETYEKTWRGDYKDFIKGLDMEIKFNLAKNEHITRIATLSNRTNEMNAARNRYSDGDIERFINSENYILPIVFLKDKFGDYGLIGEAIIEKVSNEEWFLKDICVSCRVMGRGIGSDLMLHIINLAKNNNVKILNGMIILNKENWRMPELFKKHGFSIVKEENIDGFNITNYQLRI